jgi:hypothetical protein
MPGSGPSIAARRRGERAVAGSPLD